MRHASPKKMIIVIWITACLPNNYRHVRDECSILEHDSISLMTLNHTTHLHFLLQAPLALCCLAEVLLVSKKEKIWKTIYYIQGFNPGRGDEMSPNPACINTIYPEEKTCTKLICYRGFRLNFFRGDF